MIADKRSPALEDGAGASEDVIAGWLDYPKHNRNRLAAQAADGTVRIQTFSDGSYEPAEHGILAYEQPVQDWRGNIIDAVAWPVGDESRWWLRDRVAVVLGEDALMEADWHRTPVWLVGTPAAWVRERCSGKWLSTCIVDWQCDPREVLGKAREVRCDSNALARRLRQRILGLASPRFRITVRGARHAA